MKKIQIKKTYFLLIIAIAIIFIGFIGIYIKNKSQSQIKSSLNKNTVLINREDGIYELDLDTKELKVYENSNINFLDFTGLPEEIKTNQISVMNAPSILSQDKNKSIIISTTFDETKKPSEFDGSLPIIKADEFTCDAKTKQCLPSDIISSAYKAIGETGKWYDHSPYYWVKWDSTKNLLLGYLSGEGIGNASPVYIFNTNSKILQKTINYNSLDEKEKRAEVPAGTFSPSLAKFVMIDENWNGELSGDKWDLLLYESNNLSTPLKKIDISIMKDKTDANSRIDSVDWSMDEKTLVLETNKQIYTLNLDSGKINLRYTDKTQDTSGLWLDFNAVKLLSNERYIVFVDYDKGDLTEDDMEMHSIVKAIDLKDDNKIIELLQEDNVSLNYQ